MSGGNFSGFCNFAKCGDLNSSGSHDLFSIKSFAVSNIGSDISEYLLGPHVAPNGSLVNR